MNLKCEKCGAELEPNAKFCTSCGEEVLQETSSINQNNDLPKKILFLSIVIGLIPALFEARMRYNLTEVHFFDFAILFLKNALPSEYAGIIGYAAGSLSFPAIIVGFIWSIKSLKSKKYEKPILHIFIGSIIVSILLTFKFIGGN